jgi:hypothetical protein
MLGQQWVAVMPDMNGEMLAVAEVEPASCHGEIAAEFTRRLIRQRKIFGGEIASILDDLKTRRHQADYSTVSMSDKIAQRTLDKARKLVELIGATLESTGGKR